MSDVPALSWPEALAWRMGRQHLGRRAGANAVVEVVERLCGLQAQLLSCAELALWARVDGLRRGVLADELWAGRRLTRLWAMRGTVHVLSGRDLRTWLPALTAFRRYGPIGRASFDALAAQVGRAVEGRLLTRAELADAVSSPDLSARLRESWGLHLKPASLRGRLCFGPPLGRAARFTDPASWLGYRGSDLAPRAAHAEAVRRYLAAYGPASEADVARWFGAGLGPARAAIAALEPELREVSIEGERRWVLRGDVAELAGAAPRAVALLPAFDQWTIAAPRGLAGALDRAVYRPQGWISPVLVAGGRIEGVWRHEVRARALRVEIAPFRSPARWVRDGADAQAERLAGFAVRPLELRWAR